ncbi:hypothetical protein ILYODFUR_033214 [Ilyodon furcidens]|uniref:Uncharacterized protein n=1 Tax=Ilyodon furcidens TaxID=33524 RepID=A0ABV0UAX2_9TELE
MHLNVASAVHFTERLHHRSTWFHDSISLLTQSRSSLNKHVLSSDGKHRFDPVHNFLGHCLITANTRASVKGLILFGRLLHFAKMLPWKQMLCFANFAASDFLVTISIVF